ncbi:UDP-2,3-diacylglucosamine diphosphatase LpxI domain-containing protein [Maritalea sp.]|uniref:UDP-2,3-diacylglucosamine diphosphatase LpxI domain-containing protein n=1 Tax=Maritalea sp. TaxID=2003361 RepID=UPI003EF751E6
MSKLALLVGNGELAKASEQGVRAQYRDEFVIWSMTGNSSNPADNINVGDPTTLIDRLRAEKIEVLCAVGAVELSPELRTNVGKYLVEHYAGKLDVSDMGLETAYRTIAKDARVDIKGIHDLVPELLAGPGQIGGPETDVSTNVLGNMVQLARTVARTDLGQSVVFHGLRPIAAEDVLGTDSLIERAKIIAEKLNIQSGELTLVKVAKPQQSGLGDMPTIGPETVINCAAAGVGSIVVEGQKCLIADRKRFVELANELNVSAFGWG